MKKFLATLMFALVIATTARAAEFEMVEYSAQVKLQWLTAAGIPEAKNFLKLLERPVFFNKDNLDDFTRIQMTNALYQELNYAAAIEYVREKNYGNVLDLACSFSPRGMTLAQDGRKVIVGELDAVCVLGDYFMDERAGENFRQNISYEVIPVGDFQIMMTNADKFAGKICIIEQGLMIYLEDEVRDSMFDNICDILHRHGGCMITSDFCQKKYFTETAAALYGKEEAPKLYAETKAIYEKVLEDKLADDVLQDEKEAIEYLKAHGLRAEKVPLFKTTPKLFIYDKLSSEQIKDVKALAKKNYLWVITVI